MTVTRPSNLDVTQSKKPYVYIGSIEDATMTKESAIRFYKAEGQESGLGLGGGGGGGDEARVADRPELSDIESITQTIYYDSKKKKKFVKLTIKIRNNSGKTLLGMDARVTVPAAAGGQA